MCQRASVFCPNTRWHLNSLSAALLMPGGKSVKLRRTRSTQRWGKCRLFSSISFPPLETTTSLKKGFLCMLGREERGTQGNLVKDSVSSLRLYNRTAFCPFQRLAGQKAGNAVSGSDKVKSTAWDAGKRGSLGCLQEIPQGRGLT